MSRAGRRGLDGGSSPVGIRESGAGGGGDAEAQTDGGAGSLAVSVSSYAPKAVAGGFTRAFVNDGADLVGHDVRLLADGGQAWEARLALIDRVLAVREPEHTADGSSGD